MRILENESRKIEINKNYSIVYRRLRCMKIFLSIYLVALKSAVFCSTDVRYIRRLCNAAQVPAVCAEDDECSRTERSAGGNLGRPAT